MSCLPVHALKRFCQMIFDPRARPFQSRDDFVSNNKIVCSADPQPVGQGANGPPNHLLAGQDFISLCVYYDLELERAYIFRASSLFGLWLLSPG